MKKYNIDINKFLKIIDVNPKNINIFYQALTHKTFANENKNCLSYEKLEFVGDSILQMYSTLFIYENFKNIEEGKMSIIRANNVSSDSLAKIIKNNKINEFLICSNKVEELRNNNKICSDLFESILAAIFIDQGYSKAKKFLNKFLFGEIKKTNTSEESLKDPKTRLQELLQPQLKHPIHYISHQSNDLWISKAMCLNITYGNGKGKTKKEAETNAARSALSKLKTI